MTNRLRLWGQEIWWFFTMLAAILHQPKEKDTDYDRD